MISKKLDNFFRNYLWMIEHEEYRMFNNASGKVVPTKVANGNISDADYTKRCSEFLDKAEKLLDKETLAEMAAMFKTADIDLESNQLNSRWKKYLTLAEVFQYPNGEYNADAFDKEIIQSRNPVDPDPELTDKLDNRSGKEYTGQDAVYMIVGQVKIPASSKPADTYYYSTLKNNWVKDIHEGTQYDSKADAEEDLWDAENLFIDDYSGETRFGWKYQLAVKVVGRKPRKGDHKNLNMAESTKSAEWFQFQHDDKVEVPLEAKSWTKQFRKLFPQRGFDFYVTKKNGLFSLFDADDGALWETGFKTLDDTGKFMNIISGYSGSRITKSGTPEKYQIYQLTPDAIDKLKSMLDAGIHIEPYNENAFVIDEDQEKIEKIVKKYKLESAERTHYGNTEAHLADMSSRGNSHTAHETDYTYNDLMKYAHASRRQDIDYKYSNDLELGENMNMNIYEKLSKIDDNESLSEKYNVKNAKELKKLKESLKEDTSMYSNRVEGNNRYFDTMGNKIRYCLLDVIRCKGYTALYRYMQSLDPDAFSAYAPDFTTKLGDQYQEDSVHINRADTFGKIADDLQQQFIKIVSRVDSRKHSVYEDKTPEELWNNSPVEIDGKQYAKVQNLKKKFDID